MTMMKDQKAHNFRDLEDSCFRQFCRRIRALPFKAFPIHGSTVPPAARMPHSFYQTHVHVVFYRGQRWLSGHGGSSITGNSQSCGLRPKPPRNFHSFQLVVCDPGHPFFVGVPGFYVKARFFRVCTCNCIIGWVILILVDHGTDKDSD